jgi:hypothetical protein
MTRSDRESPVLEIGTPGLMRRGLETGLFGTAPVLDPTNRAGRLCQNCVRTIGYQRALSGKVVGSEMAQLLTR